MMRSKDGTLVKIDGNKEEIGTKCLIDLLHPMPALPYDQRKIRSLHQ